MRVKRTVWQVSQSVLTDVINCQKLVNTISSSFSANIAFRVNPTGTAEANLFLYLNLRPILNYLDRSQLPPIEAR